MPRQRPPSRPLTNPPWRPSTGAGAPGDSCAAEDRCPDRRSSGSPTGGSVHSDELIEAARFEQGFAPLEGHAALPRPLDRGPRAAAEEVERRPPLSCLSAPPDRDRPATVREPARFRARRGTAARRPTAADAWSPARGRPPPWAPSAVGSVATGSRRDRRRSCAASPHRRRAVAPAASPRPSRPCDRLPRRPGGPAPGRRRRRPCASSRLWQAATPRHGRPRGLPDSGLKRPTALRGGT
jgi:hypothetical protein